MPLRTRTSEACSSPTGTRYDSVVANNRTFCPGDHRINGAENPALYPSATYRFYAPDNTPLPVSDNPLVTLGGCSATTYRPYGTLASETVASLPTQVSTPGSYANQVFHKWVDVTAPSREPPLVSRPPASSMSR